MTTSKNWKEERILWLAADMLLLVDEMVAIPFSSLLDDRLADKILELGYNGVVFGHGEELVKCKPTNSCETLLKLSEQFQKKEINLYFKLIVQNALTERCPASSSYQKKMATSIETVRQKFPKSEHFFWESQLHHPGYFAHLQAKYALQFDLIKEELHNVEKNLNEKSKLIFYVPTIGNQEAERQAEWLPRLNWEARRNTSIAFSSVAGHYTEDHAPLHPFWDVLDKWQGNPLKTMLPIINIGGVRQGEGLWPSLSFDLFELLPRISHYQLANPLVVAPQIPPGHGFLDCNLRAFAEMQNHLIHGDIAIENWFKRHKSEIPFGKYREVFKKIRKIVTDLSLMRYMQGNREEHEEARHLIETILSQLKYLEVALSKEKTDLFEYFTIFCRDARRIVGQVGQHLNVNTPPIKDDPSFWTSSKGSKISLLDQPVKGMTGSKMEKIFFENRTS